MPLRLAQPVPFLHLGTACRTILAVVLTLSLAACNTASRPPTTRAPVVPWPPVTEWSKTATNGSLRAEALTASRMPGAAPLTASKAIVQTNAVPKHVPPRSLPPTNTVAKIVSSKMLSPTNAVVKLHAPSNTVPSAIKSSTTVIPSWLKPTADKKAVRLPDTPKGWTRLDGCRLDEKKDHDGDSFHVTHADTDYRFRIYFADCPETDLRHGRYLEQMTWFEVDKDRVLKYGEKAKDYTEHVLRRPFTVYTRWSDARGEGATKRFYAMIYTSEGESLAESLVESGLARAHGEDVDFPGVGDKRRICNELEDLEAKARKGRLGIYKTGNATSQVAAKPPAPIAPVASPAPVAEKVSDADAGSRVLILLNSASREELLKLPSVGETLADRIIAGRRFTSKDDVINRVHRLGAETYGKIEAHIEADRGGR